MKKQLLLILPFCYNVLINVSGQSLFKLSMEAKVSNAALIAEGKVISQKSFWNDTHTMIFTTSKIALSKIFKGITADTIEIVTQGGTVDNVNIQASELLELQKGDAGLFFCHPNKSDMKSPFSGKQLWDVYGSAQGCLKYDMQKGTATAPFARYEDVEKELYQELAQKVGIQPQVIDPAFSSKQSKGQRLNGLDEVSITSFSPSIVNAGAYADVLNNVLTINGSGFGTATEPAGINFDNPDNGTGGTPYFVSAISDLIISWSSTQIVVRVPAKVGTGTFSVVESGGTSGTSLSALQVRYAILGGTFMNPPVNRASNLMDVNGSGGYDYYYSTSALGGGEDFSQAAAKDPFERAITTWREVSGLNFSYAGTTNRQVINLFDDTNVVMMDNTNTGVPPLPDGVLGVCYAVVVACPDEINGLRYGFDIIVRNAGVSVGSVTFNLGPCKTPESEFDLETVLLHELGHALGLGHINDTYLGTSPNIDPGKLMNYAIVDGADRRSPDWSAYLGAQYCINPRGLSYGDCNTFLEMTPLATITETKDECPGTFPMAPTPPGTTVAFDLAHASSNKTGDPQYTSVLTSGVGTGITNNAYYALRTNSAGSLNITVTGYTVTPPDLYSTCNNMGVELSLYDVSSCPSGQDFPVPIAYRTFSANGALTSVPGLSANATYLLMADGINNTMANFNLVFGGVALPIVLEKFSGQAFDGYNQLVFKLDATSSFATSIVLEKSIDQQNFLDAATFTIHSMSELFTERTWKDEDPLSAVTYYRLRLYEQNGTITYSKIISLAQSNRSNYFSVMNPVQNYVEMRWKLFQQSGALTIKLMNSDGKLLQSKTVSAMAGSERFNVLGYASGLYYIEIMNSRKQRLYTSKVIKQ